MYSITTLVSLLGLAALSTAYQGDMTYYDPGLGSCGAYSAASDYIVALAPAKMQGGRACFTKIGIWNPDGRRKVEATVVDTCMGCKPEDIDVSPALFKMVAPNGDGRVHGIAWGGDTVGGKRLMRRGMRSEGNETLSVYK